MLGLGCHKHDLYSGMTMGHSGLGCCITSSPSSWSRLCFPDMEEQTGDNVPLSLARSHLVFMPQSELARCGGAGILNPSLQERMIAHSQI